MGDWKSWSIWEIKKEGDFIISLHLLPTPGSLLAHHSAGESIQIEAVKKKAFICNRETEKKRNLGTCAIANQWPWVWNCSKALSSVKFAESPLKIQQDGWCEGRGETVKQLRKPQAVKNRKVHATFSVILCSTSALVDMDATANSINKTTVQHFKLPTQLWGEKTPLFLWKWLTGGKTECWFVLWPICLDVIFSEVFSKIIVLKCPFSICNLSLWVR